MGSTQWKPRNSPPHSFRFPSPGGGHAPDTARECSMERIESGPQCCPASSPRSVSTRPPIVESALMEATEVNLFHVSLTQTPPHFRPTASSPRRLDFLWTKKVSSRWHQFMASCALLLRRMASWKRRFSPRRSLLTTRGADTGDFKSPALALGRGAGTRAELPTNQN